MFELFFRRFNEKVAISPQEEDVIKGFLVHKKLRRNQYLLQSGDICKHMVFVEKGILRAYIADSAGVVHITAFTLEGKNFVDMNSFVNEIPSGHNIDAIEDSELILISKSAHEALLRLMPKYETFVRILMTNDFLELQRRTANIISLSLEERYPAFLKVHPDLLQRVPLHMIASYMGISAETLSRVRSRLNSKA